MKKYLLLIFAGILLCNSVFAQEDIILNGKPIDEYITESMKRWEVPGVSVAIIKDGEIVLLKGYGIRELGKSDKVDENTIFAVASNTKPFTGTLVAMLEAEKKLFLDDKITDYIKSFLLYNDKFSEVATIKDMLTHRIGLGTFHGDFLTWGTKFSRGETISMMKYVKPIYDYRSGFGYNNSGFLVAGEIAGFVSKKSWDELIKEYFFIPLEMNRSCTSVNDLKNFDNVATPHSLDYDFKYVPVPWRNVDNIAPAASINSSAADMANWILMQVNEGKFKDKIIFDKKILLKTQTPYNVIPSPTHGSKNLTGRHFMTYGLGWFMMDYKGKLLIEHSGGYDGMVSRTAFLPEEKAGLVILTNNDQNGMIYSLMYQIFDWCINAQTTNWDSVFFVNFSRNFEYEKSQWENILEKKDVSLKNSFDLNNITGTYFNEAAGNCSITFENDKYILRMDCRNNFEGTLEKWRNDTLLFSPNDYVFNRCLVPVIAKNGKIESFKIKANDFIDPLYYEFIKQK